MASEAAEFAGGASALEKAKRLRRRGASLRGSGGYGVPGVWFGLGAYGSPIGAVTGVQQPTPPAEAGTTPGDAMSADQFGGATGDAGGSGMSTGGAS